MSSENANVNVFIRCRPPPPHEAEGQLIVSIEKENPKVVNIVDPGGRDGGLERDFIFDHIFPVHAEQSAVYEEVCRPSIEHVMDGFNSCVFAYGQTGSGKTYSVFGTRENPGMLPRAIRELFDLIERRRGFTTIDVYVSFLEIYMDCVGDLGKIYLEELEKGNAASVGRVEYNPVNIQPSTDGRRPRSRTAAETFEYPLRSLEIRQNANNTVYVKNLSIIQVNSVDEVFAIINAGASKRATFETQMNEYSSRSHTVFSIRVVQSDPRDEHRPPMSGILNLVDLAGSERLKRSESEGQRLKEAVVINKSLSALGNVILGIDRKDKHIPYRDSKLTRILQDSLGGNSYTSLLATVTPSASNYEESLASLLFALRCKNVQNQPRVNYLDMTAKQQESLIAKLQEEIASLRERATIAEKKLEEQAVMETARQSMLSAAQLQESLSRGDATSRSKGRGEALPAQVLARVERKTDRLKAKLDQRKGAFKILQDKAREEQQKQKALMDDYRKRLEALDVTLETDKKKLLDLLESHDEAHQESVEEILSHNHHLLKQQNDIISSIPRVLAVDSQRLRSAEEAARQAEQTVEERYRDSLRQIKDSNDKVVEEIRSMFQDLLKQKTQECQGLRKEYENFIEVTTKDIMGYREQLVYCFSLIKKLATIVENMERGRYTIEVKSGIRRFRLPKGEKPELHEENIAVLERYIARANRFVCDQGGMDFPAKNLHATADLSLLDPAPLLFSGGHSRTQSQGSSSFVHSRDMDFPSDGGMGSGDQGGASAAVGRTSSGRNSFRELAGTPTSSSDQEWRRIFEEGNFEGLERGQLVQLLCELRDHSSQVQFRDFKALDNASLRSSQVVEQANEQLLNELADNRTVQYIRKLEKEVQHYKEEMRHEQQKHRECRVALEANRREFSRFQQRVQQQNLEFPPKNSFVAGIPRPQSAYSNSNRSLHSQKSRPATATSSSASSRPQTAPVRGRR
mgnify:FL=1